MFSPSAASFDSGFETPTSPTEPVFIVPPPSVLLSTPLLTQANSLIWGALPNWSQLSGENGLHQAMEKSMRQIENRLVESGVGKENIWKRLPADSPPIHSTPCKRQRLVLQEEPINLRVTHANADCKAPLAKVNVPRRPAKVSRNYGVFPVCVLCVAFLPT